MLVKIRAVIVIPLIPAFERQRKVDLKSLRPAYFYRVSFRAAKASEKPCLEKPILSNTNAKSKGLACTKSSTCQWTISLIKILHQGLTKCLKKGTR